MHEVSLAESIIELIEQAALREGFALVRMVRLEIGELACVAPDALETAFAAACRDTCAEQARIEIETVAGEGECPDCGIRAAMPSLYELCPQCGERPLRVIRGTELRVSTLDVE